MNNGASETEGGSAPDRLGSSETGPLRAVILLADDDAGVRKSFSRLLSAYGYRVHVAADGRDAVSMAAQIRGQLDLLITDIDMPHVNGIEAARLIRTAQPGLPVLFMSGRDFELPDLRGEDAKRSRFLSKVIHAKMLISTVTELLAAFARPKNGVSSDDLTRSLL